MQAIVILRFTKVAGNKGRIKNGRSVFCFCNVANGCIGAFERFNCLMKLSVGKPQYCIIKLTFAGKFSLFASSLLTTWFNNLFNCSRNNRLVKIWWVLVLFQDILTLD